MARIKFKCGILSTSKVPECTVWLQVLEQSQLGFNYNPHPSLGLMQVSSANYVELTETVVYLLGSHSLPITPEGTGCSNTKTFKTIQRAVAYQQTVIMSIAYWATHFQSDRFLPDSSPIPVIRHPYYEL